MAKTPGELDNTFVLFVTDNGANPYDRRNAGKSLEPSDPTTTWNLGTGWAWMCNSRFRFYKQNQFEGGIATPAIVHWPQGMKAKAGAITDAPAHLIDVLPTLAEVSGVSVPIAWPGRELAPLAGVSHNAKTSTLYYKPESGTDLATAKVEVVRLRHLVEFQGSEKSPVQFITLQGFTVRHAVHTFMDTKEPLLRSDWAIYRGGAFLLTGTEDVHILDCEFNQVGGNAIFVNKYNRNVLVKGCHIHDAGATYSIPYSKPMTTVHLIPGDATATGAPIRMGRFHRRRSLPRRSCRSLMR